MTSAATCTATRLKRLSVGLLILGLVLVPLSDIQVTGGDPWLELGRIGLGLATPDFFATEELFQALLNTLAFAFVGVLVGNVVGFFLALAFRWRAVRLGCAFIRAIHELFWALLFLQVFGLSTLTGILAIAIPYTGIFAKVYAEILEESDQRAWEMLPRSCNRVIGFIYARLPQAFRHLKTYSLYRLECGLRSSAILGFIGLPTLGFHLETAFNQGLYSQAAALLYLFFALIGTLRYWMRLKLIPLYLVAALWWLPATPAIQWSLLSRYLTEDLVPAPLRHTSLGDGQTLSALGDWCWMLLEQQAAPGVFNTLVLSLLAVVTTALVTLALFPLVSGQFFQRFGLGTGHIFLVVLRSIPELILAFVFLLVMGPSMLPAIIALALHNGAIIGYLVGQYSNALLLRPDACGGINRYLFEVLPRVYRQFLAYLFYRWEVIMRETAILGILGIHTLGFYVDSAFEELRFDRALFLILITALLNLTIDKVSRTLRSRLNLARRPMNC